MKKLLAISLSALILTLSAASAALAGEWDNLSKKKVTTLGLYFHPADAMKYVQENQGKVLFLDVRSREEVQFLGMSTLVDANIPYMQNPEWPEWNDAGKNFKLEPNSNFAADVERRLKEKGLAKTDTIILMCRSGDRSSLAVNLLAKQGFTKVYSVTEGYEGDLAADGPMKGTRSVNGWKNDGLPWSYELDKKKVYGFAS